jgi:hypothetical protein
MGEEEERCVMLVVLVGHNTAAIRRTHAESDLGTAMCLNSRHSCVASLALSTIASQPSNSALSLCRSGEPSPTLQYRLPTRVVPTQQPHASAVDGGDGMGGGWSGITGGDGMGSGDW